jgi:type II secretory pathway pseudopilin PulG
MWIFSSFIPLNTSRRFIRYMVHYSSVAWLELLICIAIIAILTATGARIYREQIRVAHVARAILGLPLADIKTDMMVYHAHTGQWPDSFADLQKWPVFPHYAYQTDPSIKSVSIENGAIDIVLNAPFAGRTVTVRPAVPKDDPLGPVAWYAGQPLNGTEPSLAGKDKTNMPQTYIHPRLR